MNLKNDYYRCLVKGLRAKLSFSGIPDTLENSGLLAPEDFSEKWQENKVYAFKTVSKNEVRYDVYRNRLLVSYVTKDDSLTLNIYIAKDDSPWNATSERMSVYCWECKKFFTGNFFDDEQYISGNWNWYVYENLKAILNVISRPAEHTEYDEIYGMISYE